MTQTPSWLTPQALDIYIAEVEQQSHSAAYAGAELNHFIRGDKEDAVRRSFAAAQSLLTAAAAMSKLFWTPSNKLESKKRSEVLRSELAVDDTSVLHDRAVRNGFEHFDERLDNFFASGRTNLVDQALGKRGSFHFGFIDTADRTDGGAISRLIDNVDGVVAVFGDEVKIQLVFDECRAVGARATQHRAAYMAAFMSGTLSK